MTFLAESERDRQFEVFLRTTLIPEYNLCKLPLNYGFDFMGHYKGELIIAEVKARRNYALQEIPDDAVLLSWHKHAQMMQFRSTYNVDAFFFVAAQDGLWKADASHYTPNMEYQPVLTFSSHYDKYSTSDCHPCVLFHKDRFTRLMSYEEMLAKRKEYDREVQKATRQAD